MKRQKVSQMRVSFGDQLFGGTKNGVNSVQIKAYCENGVWSTEIDCDAQLPIRSFNSKKRPKVANAVPQTNPVRMDMLSVCEITAFSARFF